MSIEWFYANKAERVGPVSETEFFDLRQTGQIGPQTLVWREGMSGWLPLSEAMVSLAPGSLDQGVCTVCARNVGAENLIAFQKSRICGDCKDAYFRRVRELGAEATLPGAKYAGFWIRVLARFLDTLILSVVTWPLSIAFFAATGFANINQQRTMNSTRMMTFFFLWSVMSFGLWVLQAVYEAWFLAKRGGTPGKLATGIRVIRPDGERLTFWRGFARLFAYNLSGLVIFIGYIMVAFDDEKRALHDRICDTRVVYRSSPM